MLLQEYALIIEPRGFIIFCGLTASIGDEGVEDRPISRRFVAEPARALHRVPNVPGDDLVSPSSRVNEVLDEIKADQPMFAVLLENAVDIHQNGFVFTGDIADRVVDLRDAAVG